MIRFSSLIKKFSFLIVWVLVFTGCSEDPETPSFERVKLVDYEKIADYTVNEIKNKYNLNLAEHSVDIYKLIYKSTYKESEINLSGIILIPGTDQAVPLLNYNHATIFNNDDAPSRLGFGVEAGDLMSSAGFITVMPDYPGFGENPLFPPPYLVAESYVPVAKDMIEAALEFCREMNIRFENQLYLCGYSEGGLATASVARGLEQSNPTELEIQAVSIGGAPLDPAANLDFYLGIENLSSFQVMVLAKILAAHLDYYQTISYEEVFLAPYAGRIADGLFNPSNNLLQIAAALPGTVDELLQPDFITALLDETSEIRQLVDRSNLIDWNPTVPVYVTHGTDDQIVPFSNAVNFTEQSSGIQPVLLKIEGGGHEFTSQFWALNTIVNVLKGE